MNARWWALLLATSVSFTSLAVAQPELIEAPPADPVPGVEPSAVDVVDPDAPPAEEELLPEDDLSAGDDAALEALLQDRVVGAASRASDSARTVPASVYTIPRDDLERFGIRSVDEALSFLGLGMYVESSGWDYVSTTDVSAHGISLRDDNRHILVLVDGHIMNLQDAGTVHFDTTLGVPLASIDSIEVMLGPGSVTYGSNAMLAVVQINTRRGRSMGGIEVRTDANLDFPTAADRSLDARGSGSRYGARGRLGISYGRLFRVHGTDVDVSAHFDGILERSATYRVTPQTGDYVEYTAAEGAWGTTPGHHVLRVPSGIATITAGAFRLMIQSSSFHRTAPFSGTWNDPLSTDDSAQGRIDLSHRVDPTARLHIRSRIYGDLARTREANAWLHPWWCLPGQTNGCLDEYSRRSRSMGVESIADVDWNTDGRIRTSVGFDLRLRHASGHPADYRNLDDGALSTAVPRPSYSQLSVLGAVFAQQVIEVSTKTVINLGARLDADSLFGVHVSPRASISISPRESTTFRLSYSEAFRGPSADELHGTDLVYLLPPTSLGAEVARFVDAEWTERGERFRLALRGYSGVYTDFVDEREATDTEVQDAIASGRLSSTAQVGLVVVPANVGRILTFGGTASATVQPTRRLELGVNGALGSSYDAEDWVFTSLGHTLPHFFGNARVAYHASDAVDLGLVAAFSSARTGLTLPGNGADVTKNVRGVGDVRATVSGRMGTGGFSYRAGVSYSFNPRSTNLLSPGPVFDSMGAPTSFSSPSAVAAPLQRLFLFVGLRYAMPTSR